MKVKQLKDMIGLLHSVPDDHDVEILLGFKCLNILSAGVANFQDVFVINLVDDGKRSAKPNVPNVNPEHII